MTDLVSLKTRQASDGEHHLHPFTDFRELREQGSRIISSARGCYIHDEQNGELLDGMSGLWCCNLGYTQPTITEAVTRQLKILPYYNIQQFFPVQQYARDRACCTTGRYCSRSY